MGIQFELCLSLTALQTRAPVLDRRLLDLYSDLGPKLLEKQQDFFPFGNVEASWTCLNERFKRVYTPNITSEEKVYWNACVDMVDETLQSAGHIFEKWKVEFDLYVVRAPLS